MNARRARTRLHTPGTMTAAIGSRAGRPGREAVAGSCVVVPGEDAVFLRRPLRAFRASEEREQRARAQRAEEVLLTGLTDAVKRK